MATKLTPQSLIASLPKLSSSTKQAFLEADYTHLSDLDGLDFASLGELICPVAPARKMTSKARPVVDPTAALVTKERRALFEATIRAGIAVTFSRDAPTSAIPTLSPESLRKLGEDGYLKLGDFAGCDFTKIYDRLGYGSGKHLLLGLVLADVEVRFDQPGWNEAEWKAFLEEAVDHGLLTWEDVAVSICGEMNPPQVGTAVANAVKHVYEKGKTMQNVWRWLYAQDGKCAVSRKRLFLEADHIKPKEQFIKEGLDVKDADTLDNFQLLSKRENVIKRGSHKLGGLSFAPAGAVLIYILLRFRPRTYSNFVKMCRHHGLTMADVRFQEAWAFAAWLAKDGEYEIDGEVAPFIKEANDSALGNEAEETVEVAEDHLLAGDIGDVE